MAKLKLPKDMVFHHDLHLLVFRPRGILTEQRVDRDIAILEAAEDKIQAPFNRFTDLSLVKRLNLDFQYVFRLSLYRRMTYAGRAPVKSAFYVTTDEAARVVKVHALLSDHSPLRVRMFKELAAAAQWLGVSVADLEMGEKLVSPSRAKK